MTDPTTIVLEECWLIFGEGGPLTFKRALLAFSSKELAEQFIEDNRGTFRLRDCSLQSITWSDMVAQFKNSVDGVALNWAGPNKPGHTFYRLKLE